MQAKQTFKAPNLAIKNICRSMQNAADKVFGHGYFDVLRPQDNANGSCGYLKKDMQGNKLGQFDYCMFFEIDKGVKPQSVVINVFAKGWSSMTEQAVHSELSQMEDALMLSDSHAKAEIRIPVSEQNFIRVFETLHSQIQATDMMNSASGLKFGQAR